jgi:hypothetical protein
MSHFAEIDKNNIVIRVLVGNNDDPAGDEGHSWFVNNLGGTWIQTSYNGNFRKNYAGIGFRYDKELDAFVPPKTHPSWKLNELTCHWEAPKPYPNDGLFYEWDEDSLDWKLQESLEPEA